MIDLCKLQGLDAQLFHNLAKCYFCGHTRNDTWQTMEPLYGRINSFGRAHALIIDVLTVIQTHIDGIEKALV